MRYLHTFIHTLTLKVSMCIFSMNLLLVAKREVVACGMITAERCVSYSDIAIAALGPVGRVVVEASAVTWVGW